MDLIAFDLEAEAEAGAKYELLAPRDDLASKVKAGDGLGVFFSVYGDESPTFARALRVVADEIRANLAAEPKEPDAAAKLSQARIQACAVYGWEGVVFNGAAMPFSRDNAIELFLKRPWIGRQIEAHRRNPGNFAPR